ncbi:MAG: Endoglucanase [Cyanobacteria bacterium RYN_339]|nr:Endoglucanase [Cyanobacteria bacterium RYN_339]
MSIGGPDKLNGPRPDLAVRNARPPAAAATPGLAADGLRLGATLGWVKAQGDRLVDPQGREVPVRGVNLGGFLVQEPWMMPLAAPVKDQATLWSTLERRFGAVKMDELRDAYRGAWLTDADFARMKAAGFTTVRLPFTYANLQEAGGYKWLDWAIERAAQHGLYTILDLHGAPGGQSDAMHTGKAGENQFFKDPKDVALAARMWQDVARRYANRPEVLGYDLLNEPMGAASAKQLYAVQDQLYQAIRAVDPRHVILLEDGYKGVDTFPRPSQYGWQNVAYSVHQYAFKAKSGQDHLDALKGAIAQLDRVRQARNVPVVVGEFNVPGGDAATLGKAIQALDAADVPWSMWTYKAVMAHPSEKNVWGLYRNAQEARPIDIAKDSPDELLAKFEALRTEHLQAIPGEAKLIQAGKPAARVRKTGLARLVMVAQDRVHTWAFKLWDAVRN